MKHARRHYILPVQARPCERDHEAGRESNGESLADRAGHPFLGANPLWNGKDIISENAIAIHPLKIGYIQYIDVAALSEIATKGLSSSGYDTGTPIDVIGRTARLLYNYAHNRKQPELLHKNIWVPPLRVSDLFEDAFSTIIRDARGQFEIHIRLQKAFKSLFKIDNIEYKKLSQEYSGKALELAIRELQLEEDKQQLRELAQV